VLVWKVSSGNAVHRWRCALQMSLSAHSRPWACGWVKVEKKDSVMKTTSKKHQASCHCGSVQFKVQLTDEFNTIRRCSCSYCRMRGAVAASAQLDGIKFLKGEDVLTLYQFNTKMAKHYFCSVCGIYTHHQRRSNPNQFGINVSCLEGVSPFDFEEVVVHDGVNHPSDAASGTHSGGILRYSKT
jgi:hypothetical protein